MPIQSHTDELWGITSHPSQHQFVSCGNDGVLYLWDALTHLNIAFKELPVFWFRNLSYL